MVPPEKKDSINRPIVQVLFDNSFRIDSIAIDTLNEFIHISNPAFYNRYSYTYLARLGLPIQSNHLKDFKSEEYQFLPCNAFIPYLGMNNQKFFISSSAPYTSLTYKKLGVENNNDEFLQVIHAQTIKKNVNLGIRYNLYGTEARYQLQNATGNNFNLFFHINGKYLRHYASFYYSSFSLNETGGIKYDSLVNYSKENLDGLEVALSNSFSETKNTGIRLFEEFKFDGFYADDSVKSTLSKGSIVYYFNAETNSRKYSDESENKYYAHYYYGTTTFDKVELNKITNRFLINAPVLWYYLPNLRLSLTNEIYEAKSTLLSDTLQINSSTRVIGDKLNSIYNNTYSTVEISQKFKNFNWFAYGDIYLIGRNTGDYDLKTNFNITMFKNIGIVVKAQRNSSTPSILYERYRSNNFYWNNKFVRQSVNCIGSELNFDKIHLKTGFDIKNVNDLIYMNNQALPAQHKGSLSLSSVYIENELYLWKFRFKNHITYQKSDVKSVIDVPEFIFYNSTDIRHTFSFFTGGKLYTRLGYDLYYYTNFYSDMYMPATGLFYRQTNVKTGGQPKIDVYLDCKVKSVSFFLKYSHVNAGINVNRNFGTVHYPLDGMLFSYGINWLFYD